PQCPLCFDHLVARQVAPCHDCGHDPSELDDLEAGVHTYARCRVFGLEIVVCNFCMVDFGSYEPTTFGPGGAPGPYGYGRGLVDVAPVRDPGVEWDWVCESCERRLAFLRFLDDARRMSDGT
ncbi:MAG: hypothetical protein AAFZ87_02560, partial [Planctomycetota bacterium]